MSAGVAVFPVVVLLAAAWAAFAWASPFGPCPKCHGTGNISRKGKAPVCPRCKGLKRYQRPGSRIVHRTVRMIRRERERTRKLKEGQP
jgi:hypothetical protein